tara:strand:+ start:113 stop:292 length:180 start_codon:yes stop_codon:yes gene_type:complete
MGKMKELYIEDAEQLAMSTRVWMMTYDEERSRRIKLEEENKQLKLTIKTLTNDKSKSSN